MSAREKILKKIRTALQAGGSIQAIKPDFHTDPHLRYENELIEVVFAENFKKNEGDFFFCESLENFLTQLKQFLSEKNLLHFFVLEKYLQELLKIIPIPFHGIRENLHLAEATLTSCELLIAQTGSILVSSAQMPDSRLHLTPPLHLVLAFSSQLVYDLKEALETMKKKYPDKLPQTMSVVTGINKGGIPDGSASGGGIGPKELVLFLVDDLS